LHAAIALCKNNIYIFALLHAKLCHNAYSRKFLLAVNRRTEWQYLSKHAKRFTRKVVRQYIDVGHADRKVYRFLKTEIDGL